MLGSGNICAFKIQRTAIPVMSHITWNSTPEWIACASIEEPLLTHYAGSPRLASFSAHPFS